MGNPTRTLTTYVGAGLSPTCALDLYMVRDADFSPESWAAIRDTEPRNIKSNIKRSADTLPGIDLEGLIGYEPNGDGGGDGIE